MGWGYWILEGRSTSKRSPAQIGWTSEQLDHSSHGMFRPHCQWVHHNCPYLRTPNFHRKIGGLDTYGPDSNTPRQSRRQICVSHSLCLSCGGAFREGLYHLEYHSNGEIRYVLLLRFKHVVSPWLFASIKASFNSGQILWTINLRKFWLILNRQILRASKVLTCSESVKINVIKFNISG